MIQELPNNEKGGVLRAFGQEAQVLINSDQTGNAFCLVRFFAECAEEWKTPEPDLRKIAEIAARYGIQFF